MISTVLVCENAGFIRALGAQRIVDVGDLHDARRQWDRLAFGAVRVTAAVPFFVMIKGNFGRRVSAAARADKI